MSTEKIFASGFTFKREENAPDFVIGSLSLEVSKAIEFIKEHSSNGWVNLDVKKSKGGKIYVELNTYKKENQSSQPANTPIEDFLDSPF